MTVQWNHKTARVNGINIHYVHHGSGKPVMLIHGWPEFWYSWRRQIPALAEKFEVIVPDMRGFGYSDKPLTGYSTRQSASDMYELARHLGHDSIQLVGHDIGVRVSFRFVLDHEDYIEKLVLLDGAPPLERMAPQPPEQIRSVWHSYFHQQPDLPEALVGNNVETYLRHFYRDWSVNKHAFADEDIAHYVTAYSQPGALRGGFNYYRASADEDPPDWQADADRTVQTPLRYLWGSRRELSAQRVGAVPLDAWTKHFPNSTGKYIGDYGHFLQTEAPDEVNRELLEYLNAG